jgi:molecular chaperone DnaJ
VGSAYKNWGHVFFLFFSGAEDDVILRMKNRGDSGEKGGPSGDLYVRLRVAKSPIFKREGPDLFLDVPITFPMAALGGTVRVPTLEGEADVSIEAGTQPGDKRVMRRKGLRRLDGLGTGNLYLQFSLKVPT